MEYSLFSPVDIRFTTIEGFVSLIASGTEQTLILASRGTVKRLNCKVFQDYVQGRNCLHIDNIPLNPSVSDLTEILNVLSQHIPFRRIVAIGGGSCIDLAKSISALYWMTNRRFLKNEDIRGAIVKKSYFNGPDIDVIVVPTTSGTGSEVTKWATIWDTERKVKMSIEDPACFPKMALLIPELCVHMPDKITLSTGLDALSHAMEAFWAVASTPLSQMLAIEAVKRIREFLPLVLKDTANIPLRQEMCLASLTAGLAFSITRTTACHSISYPLTLLHGVSHGFAAAMTLCEVMRINETVVPRMHELYGLFDGYNGFSRWMEDVSGGIQSLRLSAFGIRQSDIDEIAANAITTGRMDNNPIALTKEQVAEVLRRIL